MHKRRISKASLTLVSAQAPLPGKYSNFAAGEPNENGSEDCVDMDSNGEWNDESCYKQKQYFFIEFDA